MPKWGIRCSWARCFIDSKAFGKHSFPKCRAHIMDLTTPAWLEIMGRFWFIPTVQAFCCMAARMVVLHRQDPSPKSLVGIHWLLHKNYTQLLYIIIYYSIAITYNCKQNEHDKKILMMMMIFVIIMIMTIIVVVIAMIMVEPEIPR